MNLAWEGEGFAQFRIKFIKIWAKMHQNYHFFLLQWGVKLCADVARGEGGGESVMATRIEGV